MEHRDSHVIVIRQLAVDLDPFEDVLDVPATKVRAVTIELSGCTLVVLVAIQYLQITSAMSTQRVNRLVIDREGFRMLDGCESL